MNSMSEKTEGMEAFVFYPSFWMRYLEIPEEAERAKFLEAVCCYGVTGETLPLDWPLSALFEQCIVSVDAAHSRRESSAFGGSISSRKTSLTKEEINQKYAELGNWKSVADYFSVSERTIYYIRSGSAKHHEKKSATANKSKLNCRKVTTTCTDTCTSQGDADKLRSPEKKKERNSYAAKEIISGSRGGPGPIPQEMEPPAGCEWIGEPYVSGEFLCRQYNMVGTTSVGIVRLPL